MKDIDKRIQSFRQGMGLTQTEFAKRVGLTQAAISWFEDGKRIPSTQALEQIAKQFKVSVDTLLGISVSGSGDSEDSEKEIAIEATISKLRTFPKEKIYALNKFLESL